MSENNIPRPSLGARRAYEKGKKLHTFERYEESAEKFGEALKKAPNWDEPRLGLADSLRRIGNTQDSIAIAFTCLDAEPVTPVGVRYLCAMINQFNPQGINTLNLEGCEKALKFNEINLQPLIRFCLNYLAHKQPLSTALEIGKEENWKTAAQWLTAPLNFNALNNRLFNLCLRKGINQDLEFELLLTNLRKEVALNFQSGLLESLISNAPEFVTSLIQQCINNEFVFFVTEDERKIIQKIENNPKQLTGKGGATGSLVVIAMYQPMSKILSKILDKVFFKFLPNSVAQLLENEINISSDQKIRAKEVPSFGSINNKISAEVGKQYEENPYPRWITISKSKKEILYDDLRKMFKVEGLEFKKFKRKLLVAGCGTGSQVVNLASGFGPLIDITAIDLSKNSIAYAARKNEEFGFKNVSFLHGDILDLPSLKQKFDIIICTGVLHHMSEPIVGWKTLTDQLKSGGAMNVALYSAIWRKEKNKIFNKYHTLIDDTFDNRVRKFRHTLLTDGYDDWKDLVISHTDFYSLSGCRDLFFHSQETEYTIPRIKTHLDELNLKFLRFNIPLVYTTKFEKNYARQSDKKDLDLWAKFEQRNPQTFSGMYDFWCIKP